MLVAETTLSMPANRVSKLQCNYYSITQQIHDNFRMQSPPKFFSTNETMRLILYVVIALQTPPLLWVYYISLVETQFQRCTFAPRKFLKYNNFPAYCKEALTYFREAIFSLYPLP